MKDSIKMIERQLWRREREGLFSTIQQYSCENWQHQNTKWRVARKA